MKKNGDWDENDQAYGQEGPEEDDQDIPEMGQSSDQNFAEAKK